MKKPVLIALIVLSASVSRAALVERIMGLNDSGTEPVQSLELKIPVHLFFAGCTEVSEGQLTVAQLKNGLNLRTVNDASGRNDDDELDALIALSPAQSGPRAMYLNRIHAVFIFAEERSALYNTPALVRSKLGIP
jgi:hypothetical protein